jgi:nicotinate-nucleotide pyrophosphorylase (carboxylating)
VPAPHSWSRLTGQLIRAALDEDLGPGGDITSALLPSATDEAIGRIVARQPGIVCGLALAPEICRVFAERLEQTLGFTAVPLPRHSAACEDGRPVRAGDCVATIHGPRAALLTVERTMLNFLGRMSGVATLTARYVAAATATNPGISVLDTRKTIPGWRELDRYAVRCGGGQNHRMGLHDAVLIKDNHLSGVPTPRLAAFLFECLNNLRSKPAFVEVEVDSPDQLVEVLSVVGVDVVLLDNFSLDQVREAVRLRDSNGLRGKVALEVSGGVTLETIGTLAAAGVERISVGALTHSAPALDFSLEACLSRPI